MSLVPGGAGALIAELGDRVVLHDLYDDVGAPVYAELVEADTHEIREILRAVAPIKAAVLELAAGSGRLTLPLLALGREVTALELSSAMLDELRRRLDLAPAGLRNRATLIRADMSDFDLGRTFGAIVLAATSLTLLDQSDRRGLYASVRRHLDVGGRFLLTLLDARDEGGEAEVVHEVDTASGRAYRLVDYRVPGEGMRYVTVFPLELPVGQVHVCRSTVRVLEPSDVIVELEQAGLRVVARSLIDGPDDLYRTLLLEVVVDP